jgi:hypothetical protein
MKCKQFLSLIRHQQCYLYTFSQDILDTTITNTNVITQYSSLSRMWRTCVTCFKDNHILGQNVCPYLHVQHEQIISLPFHEDRHIVLVGLLLLMILLHILTQTWIWTHKTQDKDKTQHNTTQKTKEMNNPNLEGTQVFTVCKQLLSLFYKTPAMLLI